LSSTRERGLPSCCCTDPGGWTGLAYYRLHGSPRVYYSSYEPGFLAALAERLKSLRASGIPAWCIFDNTTLGAGTSNALALMDLANATSGS